jgi:Glutathione S-transferase, N-terminal domain
MRFMGAGEETTMLELYHHGSSVCAAKVRLMLAEKGLDWQGHYIDILKGDQFAPDYVKLNPKAVVPTLVHDGKVLTESTLICEYLDEVFPDPPLKPADPHARWQMRMWTKAVDDQVHPACAELTFSCTHRHTLARLPPDELERFLDATPAQSVKPGWKARKREIVTSASARRGSPRRSSSTTVICRRWRMRSPAGRGSPATPSRSPTLAWRLTSTGSTCSACPSCGASGRGWPIGSHA